jgi:hypothetical protein
VIDTKK